MKKDLKSPVLIDEEKECEYKIRTERDQMTPQ
jgi:hypothetical protein